MHYNFACLSSKLCCCFLFFFLIYGCRKLCEERWRETLHQNYHGSRVLGHWKQGQRLVCVCVCVWSMACFFLCISMNFILLLFSSFCKKCVFVSACLCEVSQAGFSLQKFPTAVSLFIFFQLQLDRFTWESIGLKVVYTWPQCNHFFLSML